MIDAGGRNVREARDRSRVDHARIRCCVVRAGGDLVTGRTVPVGHRTAPAMFVADRLRMNAGTLTLNDDAVVSTLSNATPRICVVAVAGERIAKPPALPEGVLRIRQRVVVVDKIEVVRRARRELSGRIRREEHTTRGRARVDRRRNRDATHRRSLTVDHNRARRNHGRVSRLIAGSARVGEVTATNATRRVCTRTAISGHRGRRVAGRASTVAEDARRGATERRARSRGDARGRIDRRDE